MKVLGFVLAFTLLGGCAPLSEQQLERREYRNADWKNQFVDYRRRCADVAGRVLIDSRSGTIGRDGVPGRGDFYTCSKRLSRN